jgi:hypothetical protein
MTNVEALDVMLRLFATSEFALRAVRSGHMPPQYELERFIKNVRRSAEFMLYKMADDDNIHEWEFDERVKAIFDEFNIVDKSDKQ